MGIVKNYLDHSIIKIWAEDKGLIHNLTLKWNVDKNVYQQK